MADSIRPIVESVRTKRSTLETDGCIYSEHFSKSQHQHDTTRFDSGVSLSFRDDSVTSYTGSDVKQTRFQSVAYDSSADDVTVTSDRLENVTIDDDVAATSQSRRQIGVSKSLPGQVLWQQDEDGDTKLHLAIIQPNTNAATYIICATAASAASLLDIANYEFQQTALHLAVITDQPNIVRLLIICGASPDLRDRHGNTALHLACARGRFSCMEALTRRVTDDEWQQLRSYCQLVTLPVLEPQRTYQLPDLTATDYEGRSCLHLLQLLPSIDRLRMIDYLITNCSANVNIQEGKSGCTLLHLSIKQRDTELFTYLLQLRSLNVNLPTYSRHTALDIAHSLNCRDMMHQLEMLHAQYSPGYITNDSSSDTEEDDRMDDYDDLVVGGQRLRLNHH